MVTRQKTNLVVLVMILVYQVPIHATFGEDAVAIIGSLSPILERIYSGTTSIKDALKFDQLLAQYDDMKNIETKANENLGGIKQSNEQLNIKTDQSLVELKRFVQFSDDAYRASTDKTFRDNYMLSKLYTFDGHENALLKGIVTKLYQGESLSIDDVDGLYALFTLNDEEKLIREMQKMGVSEANIIEMIQTQRAIKLTKEQLKEKTEAQANLDRQIYAQKQRQKDLESQVNAEIDPKNKSNLLIQLDGINNLLQSYMMNKFELDKQIKDTLVLLHDHQMSLLDSAQAQVTVQKRKSIQLKFRASNDQYYRDNGNGALSKLQKFINHVRRYFIKGV